jgi:DNA-binding response OmpR family regulator
MVLLVDQDERALRLMAWVLEEDGYETGFAHTIEHAIRALEPEPPDLVLFHLNLPRVKRASFIRDVRRIAPTAGILDVVEYRRAKGRVLPRANGELPIDADELLALVKSVRLPEPTRRADAADR